MTPLSLATCRALPEPDVDMAPLSAALAEAGIPFTWRAWDDPDASWDEPGVTLLRSTWNYAKAPAAFLAWCERVAARGRLWNPLPIVRGNVHKAYLLELAARGVPTVETELVRRGTTTDLGARAGQRVVLKPAVGAGSLGARVFRLPDELAAATAHLAAWAARGDVLVQPYVRSVETHGERSLVWIDGELTHAIRKAPRFAGDAEAITGPHPIADDERAVAAAALAPLAAELLYARVDLARDDEGQPRIMELELVEPSLFFARGPAALTRLVAALRRELG